MIAKRINYRRLAVASGGMVAATSLSTVFNIVAGLLLVRVLIPEIYGEVSYFLRVFGLIRFVGTVGLGAKLIEEISRRVAQDDTEGVRRTIYSLGAVRVILGLVLLCILVAMSIIRNEDVFLWAGLAGFVASLMDYMSATAQGFKKRETVAWMTLLQPLLYVIGIVYLYQTNQTNELGVFVLFTVSFGAPLIGYVWSVRLPAPKRDAFSWAYLRGIAVALISLFTLGLLNQLHLALGTILLGEAKLFEITAFFSAPFSLVSMPAMLGLTVTSAVFYPDIVEAMTHNDRATGGKLLETFLRGTVLLVVPISAAMLIYADFVVNLLYTDTYVSSIVGMQILSPLVMLLIFQQFLTFGLFAAKHIDYTIHAMALQVIIVFYGTLYCLAVAPDALVSGLSFTYLVSMLAGTLVLMRDLYVSIPYRLPIVAIPVAFVVSGLCFWVSRQVLVSIFNVETFPVLFTSGLIALPLCLLVCIFLLYDAHEIQQGVQLIGRYVRRDPSPDVS